MISKLILFLSVLTFSFICISCSKPSNKYSKIIVEKSCDDVLKLVNIGIYSEIVNEDLYLFCQCIKPSIKKELENRYSKEELKSISLGNFKRITTLTFLVSESEQIQEAINSCTEEIFGILE